MDDRTGMDVFNKTGRVHTETELREKARRRGLCASCGVVQTHKISFQIIRTPLTNDDVYEGKCINCNRSSVPKEVRAAWDARKERVPPNNVARVRASSRRNNDNSIRSTRILPGPATRPFSQSAGTAPALAQTSPVQPRSHSLSSAESPEISPFGRPRIVLPVSAPTRRQTLNTGSSNRSLPPIPSLETDGGTAGDRQISGLTTTSCASASASILRSILLSSSKGSVLTVKRDPSFKNASDWMKAVLDQCTALDQRRNATDVPTNQLVRTLCQIPDDYDCTVLNDPQEFERFLVKLQPTIVSISEPTVWVALASVVWKLLLIGPNVAKQMSNRGYHDLFLDRLSTESCDCEESECLLAALALFISFEPTAFIYTGSDTKILNVLHKFPEPRILEWVARCLYCLLSCMQSPEKLISTLNRGVEKLLQSTSHSDGLHAPQMWGLRALFAVYQSGDSRSKASLLTNWEQKDPGFSLMERVHMEDGPVDPHVLQVKCHLLRTLIDRNDSLTEKVVVPCTLRIMQTYVDSEGDFDDSMRIRWSLSLVATCLLHGNPDVRQRLSSTAFDFAIKVMINHPMDNTSSCAWILWNLTEDFDAWTREQVQNALQAFESSIEGPRNASASTEDIGNLLLYAYSFVGNVCNVPGLQLSDFPLESISTVGSANAASAELVRVEAGALSNLYTRFPDSYVAEHVGTISSHLITTLDSSSDSKFKRSAVCSLLCYSSRIPSLNENLTTATMFLNLANIFSESTDDSLIEEGLDLLLSIVADDSHRMDIPQRLLDETASLVVAPNIPSFRTKAVLTLQALCTSCVSVSNVRVIENCLASSLRTSAPRKHKMEACAVLSALTTTTAIEGEGPFFSMMFETLAVLLRWFLNSSRDDDYDSPLVLAVTTAFTRISKRLQQPISSENVETVVSMIYFILRHERDSLSAALEYILLAVLHLCEANKVLLIRHGIIVAAIDAMDECGGIAKIYEKGTAALALLSVSRSLQEILSIVQTDGIDVLVSALADFPDNKRIQRNVCEVLSHLTIDQEARMLISSQGGIFLLTISMASNRDCVALQERACVALQNMMTDSNDPLESSVVEAVVVAVVAALSSYPDSLSLQEAAIGALQLASSSSVFKDTVIRLNGIEAILTTARVFVSEPLLLELSFGALRSLESAKDRIVQNDGIQLVINGMLANIENDRVQKNGCGCLGMLASSPNLRPMIRDTGGVRVVLLALRAHYDSETTVGDACEALANLASSEFQPQDSEIDSIVTTMNRYRGSADIQDYGCRILRRYWPSRRNRELMLAGCDREKMETVLKRALYAFPARCSSNATEVLASF